MKKTNKIISFKYDNNQQGNFTIDSKQLSIALDGINDLMLGILYKIKKEELGDQEMRLLKDEIEKEGKGVDITVEKGSVEISVLLENVWSLLNENAGGMIASHLLYSGLREIFKKYKKRDGALLGEQSEEGYKNQVFDFIAKELQRMNEEINELKKKKNKSRPNSPFNKITVPINPNVNLGIQIYKVNNIIGTNEIKDEDKHLFGHTREHDIIFPELQDGDDVCLEGKISRGSERNEFNLRYNGIEIKCIASGNIDCIYFKKAKVTGIVDRKYKRERVYQIESDFENKPQIKNAEIDYIDTTINRNLFDSDEV